MSIQSLKHQNSQKDSISFSEGRTFRDEITEWKDLIEQNLLFTGAEIIFRMCDRFENFFRRRLDWFSQWHLLRRRFCSGLEALVVLLKITF